MFNKSFVADLNATNLNKGEISPKNAASALRGDVAFILNAVIVVVFVSFAGLAVASALIDLVSIR